MPAGHAILPSSSDMPIPAAVAWRLRAMLTEPPFHDQTCELRPVSGLGVCLRIAD